MESASWTEVEHVRLKTFRVRAFRNIIDSGPINVDDVTCLVGKNEAGKSAALQALHHLNPAKPDVKLDLLDEYPRWLKKEHEITGEIAKAIPITATFELDEEDVEAIRESLGVVPLKSTDVTVERSYAEAGLTVKADIEYQGFLEAFLSECPARLKTAIGAVTTTDALRAKLDEVAGQDGEGVVAAKAAEASEALVRLDKRLDGNGNLTAAIKALLLARLPRTFYFSSYAQLLGRYALTDVFRAVKEGVSEDEEDLAAAADFLELARVVPDTIADWDYEKSNSELEGISSLLTQRVKKHWKQNDHLRLKVAIETVPAPQPEREPLRYLQFRVEDTRHDFTSRLDRRSTGFRWFVSFMASFLEFEADTDLILLLDEPGLSLHARAQMDLLDTIEDNLAKGRQVLYTTHSPFMVRTSRLNQVRIVEDQGPDAGSVVTNDAGVVSDPDTLFPLQGALGYDVVQSIFVGTQNVLVEGVSDFIYLTAISDHLASVGRASLPDACRLLPAGGATNIPTFIALLGGQLDVVVLVDGNTNRQRIENAITRGRLDEAKVLMFDSYCSVPEADVEDLFTPGEYLSLYNAATGASLKVGDLTGADRIVKRIERMAGNFNHGLVAAHFLRDLDKSIKSLSAGTLDRFEAVIKAVTQALPTL